MERIEMLEHAKQFARESVDMGSGLGETQHQRLSKMDDETAVRKLALQFLHEAIAAIEDDIA